MWGSPGTLIAARLMLAWTGEDRWRAAWNESADALLARRDEWRVLDAAAPRTYVPVPRASARAHRERSIAPVAPRRHAWGRAASEDRVDPRGDGFRRGRPRELAARAAGLRSRMRAVRFGSSGATVRPASSLRRRRTSTRSSSRAGAELTWRAGAHGEAKGAGICHGTAGNGYALLQRSSAQATSAGSSGRVASPCTRSPRCAASELLVAGAGTRCSRATSASLSTSPPASMRMLRSRSSTLTRLAAVTPPSDALRDALAELIAIPSVSADAAHAADIEAAAAWVAGRIRRRGRHGRARPVGSSGRSSSGRSPRPSALSPRRRSSATRTSTSSRPTRSSCGSRRRSS